MAATVWIVDDEEAVREVVGNMVEELGYRVRLFARAQEALEAYRPDVADVVLTDVRMPEMDGLAFTRALRQRDPAAVVLILTGYPSVPDAVEAIRSGASDYLTKPFRLEEIRVRIQRALENRDLQERHRKNRSLTWWLILIMPLWLLLGFLLARWCGDAP